MAVGLGFFIGLNLYKKNNQKQNLDIAEEQLVDDECTMLEELNSIKANSLETKVSPSTNLTIKILYKECNHLVETTEKITDNSLINLTEEEFKEKYKDWEIQKFTSQEIVIYKEVDKFCGEHYKIKENNGYIAVYKIDKNGEESLEKTTDIWANYLAKGDIEKIKNGIIVYSKKELNKTLEDFE